jgi:hypothetical protein
MGRAIGAILIAVLAFGPCALARAQAPRVAQADGESAATAIQRAVIEEHARLRALAERFGDRHADVLAARASLHSLVESLRAELAGRGRIDRARVREWLRVQIADVDARLAELRVTCTTTHVDVRGGQARRAALDEAMRAIERGGRFVPDVTAPEPAPESAGSAQPTFAR